VTSPLVQLFNIITNRIVNSATAAAQKAGARLIGLEQRSAKDNDESVDDDNDSVTENANGN
jgi:hypothetical protein